MAHTVQDKDGYDSLVLSAAQCVAEAPPLVRGTAEDSLAVLPPEKEGCAAREVSSFG